MRILKSRLSQIIKEEVSLLLEDRSEDTGKDTGEAETGERDTEDVIALISFLWNDALQEAVSNVSDPDYRRRIVDAGYVTNFDQFKEEVISAIESAEVEASEEIQRRDAKIVYFDQAPDYESQLKVIPRITVYINSIINFTEDEIFKVLVHELSHIEETLLNHKAGNRGAFFEAMEEIMIPISRFHMSVQDRFNLPDEDILLRNIESQYRRKLHPSLGHLAIEEMRNRLRELRHSLVGLGHTMSDALKDGEQLQYQELVDKYGSPGAEFLLAIDYDSNPDLAILDTRIDAVAMSSKENNPSIG
jgi:hypothetical protein